MTTVYLAEKPSQANDIAQILGIARRGDGYLELNSGDRITWAFGHLLEQVDPETYNPAWKKWAWETLPLVPEVWRLQPVKSKMRQLKVIAGLLKSATRVVIATDAGREGEMIARELLDYFKFRGKIERLWLSSLVAEDIRRQLKHLRPNAETLPLYESALARSHADSVFGLSTTRGVTLAAAQGEVFPVGRVQTPTLAMVVKRDREIEAFVSRDYFELTAEVRTVKGLELTLKHAPDEEHRIYDRKLADALLKQAAGAQGPLSVKKARESQSPPAPFSLSTLTKAASSAMGLSAAKTLETAQALYEKKVITYPRTDCAYLAESQKAEVPGVMDAVRRTLETQVDLVRAMGVTLRPTLFDDKQLSDHHAIIPTQQAPSGLNAVEAQMYRMIALRFLQAMSPNREYEATRISLDCNGVPFRTSGEVTLKPGFSALN